MAYGVKYRVEYKDFSGIDKKIDIEERDYSGGITDCEAADDPLQIEIPQIDPVLVPIFPIGCTVNIVSTSNLMFLGLYNIDPQKLRARIYAGGSSIPYFTGYVNPEVYNESYARLQDYDVSVYCNDGFATLDRYKYLDESGQKYTTQEIMWNVLTRILTKMGLPFQYLYFASRYSCNGISVGSTETLWHNLKVDQLNYYDEQDEPMTFMAVLESILAPFGLQIRWYGGSLIIYEPSMLAETSFSAKRFNSSYSYVDTVTLGQNLDISNGDINWDNDDQSLDIISGYSKQKIRYSPYVQKGAIPFIDVADRTQWNGAEAWTTDGNMIYRLTPTSPGIKGIAFLDYRVVLSGHKQFVDSDEDIYITMTSYSDNFVTWFSIDGFHVALVDGCFLAITGEIYINTKANEFDDSSPSMLADMISIPIFVEIGGYRRQYVSPGVWNWVYGGDGLPGGPSVYKDANDTTLCDKWMPFTEKIPITDMPPGKAVLKLIDPEVWYQQGKRGTGNGLRQVRIRKLEVKCYKAESTAKNMIEVSAEDPEYTGQVNASFENEGSEITLNHADAVNITDRGGIMKLDLSFTKLWRKTGDSTDVRLVDLLLRSIVSQYQDSLVQLSGTMEADALMASNGGPSFLFTVQDTDNLGTRKLFFTGGTYDDFYRTLNGSFLEIRQEDLTINVI